MDFKWRATIIRWRKLWNGIIIVIDRSKTICRDHLVHRINMHEILCIFMRSEKSASLPNTAMKTKQKHAAWFHCVSHSGTQIYFLYPMWDVVKEKCWIGSKAQNSVSEIRFLMWIRSTMLYAMNSRHSFLYS